MRRVSSYTGAVQPDELGVTFIHEHVFVTHPELDANLPHPEWDEEIAVSRAISGLTRLYDLGVETVVDLTVPGLGRRAALVARVASQVPVHVIASTGYYTSDVLPTYFHTHGPGRLVGGADPLLELFVHDIEHGIAGTGVRAGMLKVVSDSTGFTPDVERVFSAAAVAHKHTGVPITTHSNPAYSGGLQQQDFLERSGVSLDRVVIGHSGDSGDLRYLRSLLANGSYIGFDRFGMEHVRPDHERVRTLLTLLEDGYNSQIVLSHDAAFFSRVTPPSWRAANVPNWRMDNLHTRILPWLRNEGVSQGEIRRMLVENPRRILCDA